MNNQLAASLFDTPDIFLLTLQCKALESFEIAWI